MRLLRWSGYFFVVLLALVATVLVMGSRLPVEHTASVSAVVEAPQDKVWAMISDVSAQPGWRTGLKAVEMLPEGAAGPCWREVQSAMSMPLCVTASEAPRIRVATIADPKLPFGGSWTYQLEPAGAGATRVTITERGTTKPAMWRFAGHYLMGEDGQIKQYLRDLVQAARAR